MISARSLCYRVYQDFFMPSRLEEYRRLLRHLRDLGYRFSTMAEFAAKEDRGGTVCLLRNDVDSDPAAAACMFACEREEGARSTYYFRLSTIDAALIGEIVAYGSEAGYHYEEIATFARLRGISSQEAVEARMDEIRVAFRNNIQDFRRRSGVSPRTVASHGDFINRRLGLPNSALLTRVLMDELGIVADAYDYGLHAALNARFSDRPAPEWWRPANPCEALHNRPATISILVHPKQWHCSPALNFRLAASRFSQEAAWRWRVRRTLRARQPSQTESRA